MVEDGSRPRPTGTILQNTTGTPCGAGTASFHLLVPSTLGHANVAVMADIESHVSNGASVT